MGIFANVSRRGFAPYEVYPAQHEKYPHRISRIPGTYNRAHPIGLKPKLVLSSIDKR